MGKVILTINRQDHTVDIITTIEGLDPNGNHPAQKAWNEADVPQCGYCQGGQIRKAIKRAAEYATDEGSDSWENVVVEQAPSI